MNRRYDAVFNGRVVTIVLCSHMTRGGVECGGCARGTEYEATLIHNQAALAAQYHTKLHDSCHKRSHAH